MGLLLTCNMGDSFWIGDTLFNLHAVNPNGKIDLRVVCQVGVESAVRVDDATIHIHGRDVLHPSKFSLRIEAPREQRIWRGREPYSDAPCLKPGMLGMDRRKPGHATSIMGQRSSP